MDEQRSWIAAPATKMDIAPQQVHVWRFALEQSDPITVRLRSTLSSDELNRAEQFKFEKLQRRFVIARGALRDILCRYLHCAPVQILFAYEKHGKPKLADEQNEQGLHFNLSHAENLALCAVTLQRMIGVDVEFVRPLADAATIAQRFFAPSESSAFCALPEEKKTAAFFNCWTRKEAFIKAIGEGLSHPLHRFEVSFQEHEPAALLCTRPNPLEARTWKLYDLKPAADYAGALVVETDDLKLNYWQWEAPIE